MELAYPAKYGFIRKRIITLGFKWIALRNIRFSLLQKQIAQKNIRFHLTHNRIQAQIFRLERIIKRMFGKENLQKVRPKRMNPITNVMFSQS